MTRQQAALDKQTRTLCKSLGDALTDEVKMAAAVCELLANTMKEGAAEVSWAA